MMKVVLHLGAHRCATTTFQDYLRRNRDRLAEDHLALWGPRRTRAGLFRGLQPGAVPVPGRDPAQRGIGRVKLGCLREAANGTQTLLVSDENMLGTMRENLRLGALYPAAGERVARYGAAFDTRVSDVVISIRALEWYWPSVIGYGLTRGLGLPKPAKLDRLACDARGWRDVVTDVACAAGEQVRVWVLPFETCAGRPDAQLAAITERPAPPEHARLWLNATPRLPALRELVAGRDAAALPPGDGRWQPFDVEQRRMLRERYADDMAWLRAGADGLARLVDDRTTGRADTHRSAATLTRGSRYDDQERRMARAR
jgi:hypothetical protein